MGKENAESNAGDDRAAKRARGSPFGDDHVELVELLGRIGVEPPRDDATSAASPRLVVASALETRMAAQQAVLDDDTKTSLLAALAALWDTSERWLRMCLSPSVASDGGAADSLVKILLRVDALQPALIETLLERVVAIASEAFDTDAPLSDSTPRLVLAHVRWLEAVADPASLVVKLLQVLDVCPAALQREVVALVPEVAEDAQHELIVDTLHELIVQVRSREARRGGDRGGAGRSEACGKSAAAVWRADRREGGRAGGGDELEARDAAFLHAPRARAFTASKRPAPRHGNRIAPRRAAPRRTRASRFRCSTRSLDCSCPPTWPAA